MASNRCVWGGVRVCVCVCFRARAHAYCTPPTHKRAKGRNPTLRGNTQYPPPPPSPATQLALASPLIQDTLKRQQEGVLTLTFPCESGGGMETV